MPNFNYLGFFELCVFFFTVMNSKKNYRRYSMLTVDKQWARVFHLVTVDRSLLTVDNKWARVFRLLTVDRSLLTVDNQWVYVYFVCWHLTAHCWQLTSSEHVHFVCFSFCFSCCALQDPSKLQNFVDLHFVISLSSYRHRVPESKWVSFSNATKYFLSSRQPASTIATNIRCVIHSQTIMSFKGQSQSTSLI